MNKNLFLLPIICIFLTSCDFTFFSDVEEEKEEPTPVRYVYNILDEYTYTNDKWCSISYDNIDYFFSDQPYGNDGVKVTLTRGCSHYKDIKVKITTVNTKRNSESNWYEWPHDSDGIASKAEQTYGKQFTGSLSKVHTYFETATGLVNANGAKFYLDNKGYLYFIKDSKEQSLIFMGSSKNEENLIRLPEESEGFKITDFGSPFVDFPGFSQVERIIVPKNYNNIFLSHDWTSLENLKYIFLEDGCEPFNNFSFITYRYSENKPSSNSQYWHYVNGQPTVWND